MEFEDDDAAVRRIEQERALERERWERESERLQLEYPMERER
jgi:hypothetical protein